MGAVDAIVSLLADTDSLITEFLPAWNSSRYASIRGMRARGGFLLSFTCPMVTANVTSTVGGTFTFMDPFGSSTPPHIVDLSTGGTAVKPSTGPVRGSY